MFCWVPFRCAELFAVVSCGFVRSYEVMFYSSAWKTVVTLPNSSGKQCGPTGSSLVARCGTLQFPMKAGRKSDIDSLQPISQGNEGVALRQIAGQVVLESNRAISALLPFIAIVMLSSHDPYTIHLAKL